MIIDVHTHAFPAAAQAAPGEWADAHGEAHWKKLVVSEPDHPSIQGWAGRNDFREIMDRDGIDRCVLLGWYWESPESCRLQNREAADWVSTAPDRFSAFASVHPDGGTPEDWLRLARDRNFMGFGELLPAVQNSSLSDPFWHELAAGAAEAGLWFNFHVTEPAGRPHPGRIETPFAELQEFIERHRNLKIILSHWGGGLFLSELNPFVKKRFQNVWYDCSASPLLYEPTIFEVAVRTVGAGKILFGSDFPLRLYPRKDRRPGWNRFLQSIATAEITSDDREKILGGNAKNLFGL